MMMTRLVFPSLDMFPCGNTNQLQHNLDYFLRTETIISKTERFKVSYSMKGLKENERDEDTYRVIGVNATRDF